MATKKAKRPQDIIDPAPELEDLVSQPAPELEDLISQVEGAAPELGELQAIPLQLLKELTFYDENGFTYKLADWRPGGVYILRPGG